jgi:ribosomal protein S12 methylthiotransferase accessory factor
LVLLWFLDNTNGLAAGNTLEEATIQAGCEVFERWAARATASSTKKIVPTIDPTTVPDEQIQRWFAAFARQGIELMIKDFTFDGTVPVMGVLSKNHNLPKEHNQYRRINYGADFDLCVAIRRAVHERLQGLTGAMAAVSRFAGSVVPAHKLENYNVFFSTYIHPEALYYFELGKQRSFEPYPVSVADTESGWDEVCSVCERLGSELIVIDHTLPKLGMPAVRVVVPRISNMMSDSQGKPGEAYRDTVMRILTADNEGFLEIFEAAID